MKHSIQDPDQVVMNIEHGLTLLNSMQFEYKDVTIWNHYLVTILRTWRHCAE